jgi:PAS domain S-box-containing protein
MTEGIRGETAHRADRWRTMWQQAVRISTVPMALVDLSTNRFVAVSQGVADLFGITPEEGAGLDYLTVLERPREAAQTFRLAREGMLDGIHARWRYRRSDGAVAEVTSLGWVIRSPAGPELGLWAASEVGVATERSAVLNRLVGAAPSSGSREGEEARVTFDDQWRLVDIRPTGTGLLGHPSAKLVASSIIELIHPADVAILLFGLARATTEVSTSFGVRLRHRDGRWRQTRVVPTFPEDDAMAYELALSVDDAPDTHVTFGGVDSVAGQLRHIADTIEAAGTLVPLVEMADALGILASTELSPRQWGVLSRLVRGDRVPTIAAEMYLSQSTVRNYLSAIFGKLGVHSQQELLALWRGGTRKDPPSTM